MTQSQWNALDQMIAQMTSAEKQELVARVRKSPSPESTTEELENQRKSVRDLLDKMAKLPISSPDDGFSGTDHDRILYGGPE